MGIRDVLVGVDVGTTFTKVVVTSASGEVEGQAHVRTPWSAIPPGTEVDPTVLADACIACLERALEDGDVESVAALGVTSFGESGVLVDGADTPIGPIVAWHDRRGKEQAARLGRDVPDFARRAGRPADERPSVVKWRWLVDEGRIDREPTGWYSVAEWVVRRLGGTPGNEGSLVSRTGILDVALGVSFGEAVAWSGCRRLELRDIVAAGTPAGVATAGPRPVRGAVLTVAGLDCYASAHVVGVDSPGAALLSCGTSGAAIRVLDRWPAPDDMDRAIALNFTIDRFIDGVRPIVLGATPCGLILQPLIDVVGPPPSVAGDPPANPPESPAELWARAFEAVADGEARLIRDLTSFSGPLREVVAVGGWIAEPRLREGLERRLGDLIGYADTLTAADGAARIAGVALAAAG